MISRVFSNAALMMVGVLISSVVIAETVWIDVRSAIEHTLDSIDGDIRIPHDEIVEGVLQRYPNKDIEIKLYCRSGNRAGKAMAALKEAGYSNVSNEGGIDDARAVREIKD